MKTDPTKQKAKSKAVPEAEHKPKPGPIEKKAKQRKSKSKKPKRKLAPGPIEKKAKAKKPKRKYKSWEIKPWMRPALADSSEDEGNALQEWEDNRFLQLCLCGPGTDEATCTCGCMVGYTRSEWRKHKAKHGLAPPGGWAAWD
jgi:hypothetical protein